MRILTSKKSLFRDLGAGWWPKRKSLLQIPAHITHEHFQNSTWPTWHHCTNAGIRNVHKSVYAMYHISGLKNDNFIRWRKGFLTNPMSLPDKSPEETRKKAAKAVDGNLQVIYEVGKGCRW